MGWRRFLRRAWWDDERSREIEAHLQIEIDENVARGMTAEEARYAALRKLGNVARVREEIYRMNTVGVVDAVWQDLRYAVRQWRHNPGFTALAVFTLALGIGSVAVMYSVLHNVVLQPFPYAEQERMVDVVVRDRDRPEAIYRGRAARGGVPGLPGAEPVVRGGHRRDRRGDDLHHGGRRGARLRRAGDTEHLRVPRREAAARAGHPGRRRTARARPR